MSFLTIDPQPRVLVQGITGHAGLLHSKLCLEYGTNIVAGATPGKGGQYVHTNIPVFNSVAEACRETAPTVSLIFVPAPFATDAIYEAIDAKIPLIVCITEGIPVQDMLRIKSVLKGTQTRLIGPNCPGILAPNRYKIGIMPGNIFKPGSVGLVSRSGTLMFEAAWQLSTLGYGQSMAIGIGGDPIHGTSYQDVLRYFNEDPATEGIVLIGEIGGISEEQAADYIRQSVRKPVVAFIAGQTLPSNQRMGHAGAIIEGNKGTAAQKIETLKAAGVYIAPTVTDIGKTYAQAIQNIK